MQLDPAGVRDETDVRMNADIEAELVTVGRVVAHFTFRTDSDPPDKLPN
jgi:hypothetical protein